MKRLATIIERALSLLPSFAAAFPIFAILVLAAALSGCGGGGEEYDAADARADYRRSPELLGDWFAQSSAERGRIEMAYGLPSDGRLSLYIWHAKRRVYEGTGVSITGSHGITSYGHDVVLVREVSQPGDPTVTSTVLINGAKIPRIQSLVAPLADYSVVVPIVDIRERLDGGLTLSAELVVGQYTIRRWAIYWPLDGSLVDCGELDSVRDPSWGPGMSSECLRR